MQARNKAAAVGFTGAGSPVAEANDIGAVLTEPGFKSQLFGNMGQRNEPSLPVRIVSHENREFSAFGQGTLTIVDEGTVAMREFFQTVST